jgi:hypothetical protein
VLESFQIPVPLRPVDPSIHLVYLSLVDESICIRSDLGCLTPNLVQFAIHICRPLRVIGSGTLALPLLAALLTDLEKLGMLSAWEKSLEPVDCDP